MNMMKYKGYVARIEFDEDDRIFVGRLAGIDDIVSFHGTNVDELEAAFHEAVATAACMSGLIRNIKFPEYGFCAGLPVRSLTSR